jgi:hypothetical protein
MTPFVHRMFSFEPSFFLRASPITKDRETAYRQNSAVRSLSFPTTGQSEGQSLSRPLINLA